MQPLYKISKASEILGVSQSVLRKWDNEGKIKAIKTPGGMRLYDLQSLDSGSLSKQRNQLSKSIVLYSRVSSAKQKDDLQRQKEFLRGHIPDKYAGYKVIEISDVGSGINFKRPGLLRVLGSIKEGNLSAVVVASRDRMARFGFELIEWFCKESSTDILVLDDEDTTPEAELGKDLMSIVQVYCCRWNGRRRYSKNDNKSLQVEDQADSSTEETPQSMDRVPSGDIQQDDLSAHNAKKLSPDKDIPTKQVRSKQRSKISHL
jgi:putative resolvase